MAKKKSNFYHVRWNRVGINEERAADVLGVDVKTIRQWDNEGAPVMAERLLLLWDSKQLGGDWQGWRFSRGALVYKGRRWRPEGLIQWADQSAQLSALQQDLRRLKTWKGLSTAFVDKVVDSITQQLKRRRLTLG